MKKCYTLFILLLLAVCSLAQTEKSRYQMVNSERVHTIVEAFDFERGGVNCEVDLETHLAISNSIVIEITVKSNHLPYRVIGSLLDEGHFDLRTDELDDKMILDVKQIIHTFKYQGEEDQIVVSYKVYIPEHITYLKASETDVPFSTQTVASQL